MKNAQKRWKSATNFYSTCASVLVGRLIYNCCEHGLPLTALFWSLTTYIRTSPTHPPFIHSTLIPSVNWTDPIWSQIKISIFVFNKTSETFNSNNHEAGGGGVGRIIMQLTSRRASTQSNLLPIFAHTAGEGTDDDNVVLLWIIAIRKRQWGEIRCLSLSIAGMIERTIGV